MKSKTVTEKLESPESPPDDCVLLPNDFRPGSYDVICAKGHRAFNHSGNEMFRETVATFLLQYAAAKTKLEKSNVVSDIVNVVRASSTGGGFVKQYSGSWYQVGDRAAREKVGSCLRDLLHNKYRSSTKAKARRRNRQRSTDQSHTYILTSLVSKKKNLSSDSLECAFTQANMRLLSKIKKQTLRLAKDEMANPTLISTFQGFHEPSTPFGSKQDIRAKKRSLDQDYPSREPWCISPSISEQDFVIKRSRLDHGCTSHRPWRIPASFFALE